MKELWYRQSGNKWVCHYRRPDDHPDVKEWENYIAKAPLSTRYEIRTIPDVSVQKDGEKE